MPGNDYRKHALLLCMLPRSACCPMGTVLRPGGGRQAVHPSYGPETGAHVDATGTGGGSHAANFGLLSFLTCFFPVLWSSHCFREFKCMAHRW